MLQTLTVTFLYIFAICVVIEFVWSRAKNAKIYNSKETLCNMAIYAVHALIQPLAFAWAYLAYSQFIHLIPYSLPQTAWALVLTFVVTDFAYYWYHRFNHEWPALWTLHHAHHSSRNMNLTAAVRLSWPARFVTPFFFMPLFLLGMPPEWVYSSLALGLIYQFFLHTEAIDKLGWFEGKLLNTPSAHRVHHGYNDGYRDKNYAGALIIWDRLFGTYMAEGEASNYGIKGFESHNPIKVQFHQAQQYLKTLGQRRADTVINK